MASTPESGGSSTPRRGGSRRPDLETVFTINEDGSRNSLHPADVRGRWQKRKAAIFTFLIALYVALPWITIGGHPAVLVDIPGRKAFILGRSFTNQDFYLMFFVVSGIGFGLFVITALFGRAWCGFACPQTVWLEGVFRKIERWLEGPREVRIRRNQGPWTGDKFGRKAAKTAIFAVLAVVLAHLFLAYFFPIRELFAAITGPPAAHWTAFLWMAAMTAILFFNFAWFREQTCLVVCPYGRLQSALIDSETIIIGYDVRRGEPRGKLGETTGDCVDCRRCVQVCPTGIDIRNGLQLECVGCANCIDACDEIMLRSGRAPGLIRYDSQKGLDGLPRRFWRGRVFLYAFLGLLGLTVASIAGGRRVPFEARALRSPGMPYTLEGEILRNMYTLHLQNKQDAPRVYFIQPAAVPPAGLPSPQFVLSMNRVVLDAMGETRVAAFATLPRAEYREAFPVTFTVTDSTARTSQDIEVRFLGP